MTHTADEVIEWGSRLVARRIVSRWRDDDFWTVSLDSPSVERQRRLLARIPRYIPPRPKPELEVLGSLTTALEDFHALDASAQARVIAAIPEHLDPPVNLTHLDA